MNHKLEMMWKKVVVAYFKLLVLCLSRGTVENNKGGGGVQSPVNSIENMSDICCIKENSQTNCSQRNSPYILSLLKPILQKLRNAKFTPHSGSNSSSHLRSNNKVRELATVCLPWQLWTETSVWFDDVGTSAFHTCVVDLWQSLSEWLLLMSECVLVCCGENVGA
jgi:hypothetical protein